MISGEKLTETTVRKEYIVCDYDGVVQDIDTPWLKKILHNASYFNKYLDLSKLYNDKGEFDFLGSYNRDRYMYGHWLAREQDKEIPDEVIHKLVDLYMDDADFYKNSYFMTFAKALQLLLLQPNAVDKLVFLSSAPIGKITDDRKEERVKKLFNDDPRVSIEIVPGGEKKSDFINKNHSGYTTFVDDRVENLKDIILNTDSNYKTFILPLYGYNRSLVDDKEFIQKEIYDKGSVLTGMRNNVLLDFKVD